jgi:hypothetical protein
MSWIRYWLRCLAWWWSQERPLGPKAKLYETTHAGWKQVSLAEWVKMYEPAQYMDRAVDALAEENAILNGEPVPDASPCECLETEVIDDDDGLRRQCKRCGAYEMLDRELHELADPNPTRSRTFFGTDEQEARCRHRLKVMRVWCHGVTPTRAREVCLQCHAYRECSVDQATEFSWTIDAPAEPTFGWKRETDA